jgi:hypothetical protein
MGTACHQVLVPLRPEEASEGLAEAAEVLATLAAADEEWEDCGPTMWVAALCNPACQNKCMSRVGPTCPQLHACAGFRGPA